LEEASFEHYVETIMVLSKVFPGMNLFEDDNVVEEGLAIQTQSI